MQKLVAHLAHIVPRSVKDVIGKPLRRVAGAVVSSDKLEQLGLKHATDKYYHGYLAHYQKHFTPRRLTTRVVLEIGIGGYQTLSAGGDSLRMWADYFPNAQIHGIDIFDKSAHNAARIMTHRGGQDDPAFLRALIADIGRPDIVIDDGSHMNPHIITSFETLFPLLRDGGVYVIEDMQTAYLPRYDGDFRNLDNPAISTGFAKSLIDAVNFKSIPGRGDNPYDGAVKSVAVYPKLCFVEKGVNEYVMAPEESEDIAAALMK